MATTRVFGSQELAARIERAECGLLEGGVAGARSRNPSGRFMAVPLAGGIATWCGPGSPMNKVAGLGFGGAPEDEQLEALEAAFRERDTPVQVELSNLAIGGIAAQLTGRGYSLVGFENVLGLALPHDAGITAVADVEIRPARDEETRTWLDVAVEGFAAPDQQGVPSHEEYPRDVVAEAIGDLTGAAGIVKYLAFRQGEAAGAASLRVSQGVAQLAGAATRPAHRRRGVQMALLARRLEDAASAGCDIAVVTTQPGSKSQQNVQRLGFDLLYTRAVLVRP